MHSPCVNVLVPIWWHVFLKLYNIWTWGLVPRPIEQAQLCFLPVLCFLIAAVYLDRAIASVVLRNVSIRFACRQVCAALWMGRVQPIVGGVPQLHRWPWVEKQATSHEELSQNEALPRRAASFSCFITAVKRVTMTNDYYVTLSTPSLHHLRN